MNMFEKVQVQVNITFATPLAGGKNLAKFLEVNVYFFNWNEKSEAQKHPWCSNVSPQTGKRDHSKQL